MKYIRRAAGLCLALALLAPAASPAQAPDASADTLPLATREAVVARLDAAVRRYFAHWEGAPGLDYAAAFADYRARALATSDRMAFGLATMELMAGLRNGHTSFDDRWLWERHGAPLPFRLLPMDDGRWRVASSRHPELEAGDEVAAIDGEAFERFYRRQSRYVAASSDRAARRVFGGVAYLFPARFTLTLADGRQVAVTREKPAPAPLAGPAAPAADWVPHRWLVADSVAYLRIASFGDPVYQERALELLDRQYADAAALVVDLRGNGGGSTPWKLRKALMGGHRARGRIDEHDHLRPGLLWRLVTPAVLRTYPVPRFRGPLVFLVDGGCASACEDLLLPFKDNGRATLVGETTFGSTGQPHVVDFGDGMTAYVGARRVRFPDGSPFEGVGVAPDVAAPMSFASMDGDPALERALQLIRAGQASPRIRLMRSASRPPSTTDPASRR